MATFDPSSAYSIVYAQNGVFYKQNVNYFTTTFVDLGTTLPPSYQSLSSERSDGVNILGGTIDGVTLGPGVNISGSATPSGTAGGDLGGTYPNPTVSKVAGSLTSYNGDTLVGNGLAAIIAKIDLVNQSANVSSATLYAVPSAEGGLYRASCYAVETTADGASSTLPSIGIGWTDLDSSTPLLASSVSSTNTANAIGAFGQGQQVMYAKGGTNITYQTSSYASGTAGAMKYAIHVKLERLG